MPSFAGSGQAGCFVAWIEAFLVQSESRQKGCVFHGGKANLVL
jgi:hypothetical protein